MAPSAPAARLAVASPVASTAISPPQADAIKTLSGIAMVTPATSAADWDVIAARDAFDKRDLKALASVRDRLSTASHPLSSYAQYWWLSASLAEDRTYGLPDPAEMRAFLKANANSVVGDNLRRDWLKALGKRDQWALFAAEIPLLNSDDTEITCHHWRYRLSRNDREDAQSRESCKQPRTLWQTACIVRALIARGSQADSMDVSEPSTKSYSKTVSNWASASGSG